MELRAERMSRRLQIFRIDLLVARRWASANLKGPCDVGYARREHDNKLRLVGWRCVSGTVGVCDFRTGNADTPEIPIRFNASLAQPPPLPRVIR